MTDRCSTLFGKHDFKVGFWANGPLYIKCKTCERQWEMDLQQTCPDGYNSWKDYNKAQSEKLAKKSIPQLAGMTAHAVHTHRSGKDLEAEVAAPLFLEHQIHFSNIRQKEADALREVCRIDPMTIIDMINGRKAQF